MAQLIDKGRRLCDVWSPIWMLMWKVAAWNLLSTQFKRLRYQVYIINNKFKFWHNSPVVYMGKNQLHIWPKETYEAIPPNIYSAWYLLDLLSSLIRSTIPYSTVFRISQGIFSIYYLLSVSNGHFLDLSFITAAFITSLINFYKTVLCLILSGN